MITRNELGNILGSNMITKTLHSNVKEKEREINGDWVVDFIEVNKCGILYIYCSDPDFRE